MTDKDLILHAIKRVETSVDNLGAQSELTRVAVEAQGQRIASLPCRHHQAALGKISKKISDLYARVGVEEEVTSQLRVEQLVKKDMRNTWKWAIGTAIALASAVGGALAALAATGG